MNVAAPSQQFERDARPLQLTPDGDLSADALMTIVRCPRCRAPLTLRNAHPYCTNAECTCAADGFPTTHGQMVLVDFDNSIFSRDAYKNDTGSVFSRDDSGRNLRSRIVGFITGSNPVAAENGRKFVAAMKAVAAKPRVLVIGGGAIGSGMEAMYDDPAVEIVGTDVYASANTKLVADAHRLPFEDGAFDGVWIQAVLEHVLEPWRVADEIFRVLKPEGIVYADTPFMQQVHEEAYDFTRFTQSGHRWLFRRFAQIDAGAVNGPGTALVWSIRYLARALGAPNKLATLIVLPFFWLRYLDRFARKREGADAASGVFFLGRKAETALTPKDMIAYYYKG